MTGVELQPIQERERDALRVMADRYWSELMPDARVIQDPDRRATYFLDHFRLDDPNSMHWWVVVDGSRAGFAKVDLWENHDGRGATIRDLFIDAAWRRQGWGTASVGKIVEALGKDDVHRIDVSVRADNPAALAFWRSAGFELSLYQLRAYLDV
jgi:ribosomal protein S18 acetylase RimI-like enzyme